MPIIDAIRNQIFQDLHSWFYFTRLNSSRRTRYMVRGFYRVKDNGWRETSREVSVVAYFSSYEKLWDNRGDLCLKFVRSYVIKLWYWCMK